MAAMAPRRQCKRLAVHMCHHQVPGKSKQPGSVEKVGGKCHARDNSGTRQKHRSRRCAYIVHILGGKLLGGVPCRIATT